MSEAFRDRPTDAAEYLAILRRRKWIVVSLPVLAAIIAYVASASQAAVYQATAQVLVNRSNVVSAIANISDPTVVDPTRFLTTEAEIARSPVLAARVVDAAGVPGMTPTKLLDESSVNPSSNSDVLSVSVSDSNPSHAVTLANAYAIQFTLYKTELDTARINDAVRSLNARTKSLQAHGQANSPAYATLFQYQGSLETIGKLLAQNTTVLQRAEDAPKVHPRPRRNAILAGLFGGVVGIGLAFFAEAIDRRVRSEREIEEALDVPILARLPKPPRPLGKSNELVMLAEPRGVHAEAFRKLRTSLEFVNLDRGARTIMVTSALQREGKSTTIANLAVAVARTGKSVALVDLDLRRPILERFFHVGGRPGFTDVVVEQASIDDAIRPLAITPRTGSRDVQGMNGNGPASDGLRGVDGVVHLLPAGTIPPAPGEFLQNERIPAVLEELAKRFEMVLIDGPPMLAVGDAMTLSGTVDAIFAVVRMRMVQRPSLAELARELKSCRTEVLGFVLTGIDRSDGYGYVYEAYVHDLPQHARRGEERV
jgi:succinoglycan biosynthesis transport protein ExoP